MEAQKNQVTKIIPKDNEIVVATESLPADMAVSLKEVFIPFYRDAYSIANEAQSIEVKTEDDTEQMFQAKELAKKISRIRIDADKVRAALKEESLRKGKAIDTVAKIIKDFILPVESKLKEQANFIDILQAKRREEKINARAEELSKYVDDLSLYNYTEINDDTFTNLLATCKNVYEMKITAQEKMEQERIEREKKEEEERKVIAEKNRKLMAENKRIQEENARIKAEAEAKEKAEREEQEKAAQELEKINSGSDRIKIKDLSKRIMSIEMPIVKSKKASMTVAQVSSLLSQANKLLSSF